MSVMQALPGLLATPSFADLRRNMMHHTGGNPKIEKSMVGGMLLLKIRNAGREVAFRTADDGGHDE